MATLHKQSYQEGMEDGAIMVFDVLLGENKGQKIPDDVFEELKYQGELDPEMRKFLEDARERAQH